MARDGRKNSEALILRPTARRREVEWTLNYASSAVPRAKNYKQSGYYGVLTKAQKIAAKKFEVALHRLSIALDDGDLAWSVTVFRPRSSPIRSRRWYSQQRGETPGSQEVVLIHQKRV